MDVKKLFTKKYYVAIIAIFCSILWGSAFPVLKVSYKEIGLSSDDLYGKVVFAGMRFFLASIILFIIIRYVMKFSLRINKKQFLLFLSLGILNTSLQYFFFYNGLANVSGIKGSVLGSISTFFIVLFAHFIYRNDKINIRKIIGLIAGFGGIIIASLGKDNQFSLSFSFFGEGFMILAGISSACGAIWSKELSKKSHPFLITAWQMFLGSIVLLLFGFGKVSVETFTFTPKAWLLFIYSAFLSATAFSLFNTLLKYNKAGEVSIYKIAIPISGSILSAIFIHGEAFTIKLFIGLILVSLGIGVVNISKDNNKLS